MTTHPPVAAGDGAVSLLRIHRSAAPRHASLYPAEHPMGVLPAAPESKLLGLLGVIWA